MKKFFTSIALIVFSTAIVLAQPKGMGKSDPEGKKVLDAVSAKFKSYKTVTAKFSLKIENAAGKNLGVKTGTVYMKGVKYRIYMKGVKYRISVTGQEIFSDGSNVWTFDKAANEVTITKLDPSANSLTPQKLFTNFYEKDFLYKLNGPVKVGAKTLKEVELTPIDKTKPFHKVLLYVDKNAISSTKIFEKTGNRYTYSTTSLTPNAAVSDAYHFFNAQRCGIGCYLCF